MARKKNHEAAIEKAGTKVENAHGRLTSLLEKLADLDGKRPTDDQKEKATGHLENLLVAIDALHDAKDAKDAADLDTDDE